MSDFVYLLITVASFAALALVVGLIDRRLGDGSEEYADEPAQSASAATLPEHAGAAR